MNLAIQKMSDAGLFSNNSYNDDDVEEAVNTAIEQAQPIIAQDAVNKALSPDNIKKKVGLYKQGVINSIGQIG